MIINLSILSVRFLGCLLLAFGLVSGCTKAPDEAAKPDEKIVHLGPNSNLPPPPESDQSSSGPAKIAKPVLEQILKDDLEYKFPDYTVIIAVNDISRAIEKIEEASGEVVYNPNQNGDSSIRILVVTLPPKKLLDDQFIEDLNLRAISVQAPHAKGSAVKNRLILPQAENSDSSQPADFENYAVPVEDIKIPELRNAYGEPSKGVNSIVAVIDSGIDASHPAFQDRVIFWNDATQETRMDLSELKPVDEKITLGENKIALSDLPQWIDQSKDFYSGVIDESLMISQISDEALSQGKEGLDVNANGIDTDKFLLLVAVSKATNEYSVAMDQNANGKLEEAELSSPIADFNQARNVQKVISAVSKNKLSAFVTFRAHSPKIAFPLMLKKDSKGAPISITMGIQDGSHGTHVAGIIGANGTNGTNNTNSGDNNSANNNSANNNNGGIDGAAPETRFMSIRVCSDISCPEPAIIRGIVEAFNNPYGLIPDVVNISLGSQQEYNPDITNLLIRDLAAKTGAAFVVSASNNGPGYRSINSLGSLSPAILVGAHISKSFFTKHYAVDPGVEMPENNLLYFSSVGPSYNGELRPNIIAPGSSLSTIPLQNGGSDMFQGTSMSAPIISGALAAAISVVKTLPSYNAIKNVRAENAKRDKMFKSLTPIAISLRSALEDSATLLAQYTSAQQGYGLVNIANAVGLIDKKFEKFGETSGLSLFETTINGNAEESRSYRRDGVPRVSQAFSFDLENDGHFSDFEMQRFGNTPFTVKLKSVQAQNTDGSIEDHTNDQWTGIVNANTADGFGKLSNLILNNSSKRQIVVGRNWKKFKPGQTIISTFETFQNGERVGAFLDVVHVPVSFTDEPKDYYLPGISAGGARVRKSNVFVKEGQKIAANEFHRYPVLAGAADFSLNMTLALSPNMNGKILMQAFNPDGEEVDFAFVSSVDQLEGSKRKVSLRVPTVKKKGVYEIVLATVSASWMAPSKYELMIEKEKVGVLKKRIKLQTQDASGATFPAKDYLIIEDSMGVAGKKIALKIDDLVLASRITGIQVAPSSVTFRRISLPGIVTEDTVDLDLDIYSPDEDADEPWSRLDHRLYRYKSSSKEFVTVSKATADESSPDHKSFTELATESEDSSLSDELYLAVWTYNTLPDSKPLNKRLKTLDINVSYPGLDFESDGSFKMSQVAATSSQSKVVELIAPKSLPQFLGVKGAAPVLRGLTELVITLPSGKVEVPVELYQ